MWPLFDAVLADQVSVIIPLLKLKSSMKVVFYCHFPDLLLAHHTSMLRRLYRWPIDAIEEITTGLEKNGAKNIKNHNFGQKVMDSCPDEEGTLPRRIWRLIPLTTCKREEAKKSLSKFAPASSQRMSTEGPRQRGAETKSSEVHG
ncbi:hypothetical protein H6P81_006587 [Aristolochia fimbriata]|uniref:Alpha-1,3/1,6-mannosyltransferase ALG2 n=1 Tax=Aristolochia fimbriata TaxID=158543 RepID=A0AAV7EXY7_ARIFI|nr:hypothetical protein H6P81_006587 [Aristolochia fimbriata]